MIYKYLSYNYFKYIIYMFIIFILLLVDLYLNLDFNLVIIGLVIGMVIDISYSIVSYSHLEKEINSLRDGKFNVADKYTSFYKELIILTIKRVTDEYLIEMKKLKKEKEEYDEYIELWVHEVKLEIANLTQMLDFCDNNEIFRELESLNDSVERIIAIKNSEKIDISSDFQKTKLSVICNQAIKLQMNNLLANNVEVKTDYDNSEVIIDRYWIIFIIKQLINNSIKYGASEIKIKCDKQKIIVTDNGVGINNNELELVFQKFYCSTKTKENIKSTGIGLYLVKKVLDKLGFTITLENNALGGIDAIIDMNSISNENIESEILK